MNLDALDARAREAADPNDGYVAALKRELAGYEAAGREDRAAQVRAELARVSAPVDTVVDTAPAESADDGTAAEEPATRAKRRRAAASDG